MSACWLNYSHFVLLGILFCPLPFHHLFFNKKIHYFLIDDLPTLECTHRTLYWRQPLGATSFFWVGGPCGLCLRTFTTDLASVWPLKIISPSPYTHLRLLSFVHRPFLLFTRCPCSRGNVTMTNFLLPGRLLQVCTISNSPMFYLLLFCNLKFERFYFQAHTPVAFPFLHPRTPHNNTPHNTQPVLVVLCRDGGHIFPEVNGVAWRT